MSEVPNNESTSTELEKPAQDSDDVKFPPFPDPTNNDFEEDISDEERNFYKTKFKDLNDIKKSKLHCTACDRHLGCSARNEARMRTHPMLRTLVCHTCHNFYNSGEFEKGDDGSELYCRWCGQGGQVYCCSDCPHVFCAKCVKRNMGVSKIKEIENTDDWKCFKCNPNCLWDLRALCWALLRYCDLKNKLAHQCSDPDLKAAYLKDIAIDDSECCKSKMGKRKEKDSRKKEDITAVKKATTNIISKIPPTIQVKKFASINLDETLKQEKKAQKRPASPRSKTILVKNPISIVPAKMISPISMPPVKKMRMSNAQMINPIRLQKDRPTNFSTYGRIRPKGPPPQLSLLLNPQFNGFNNPNIYNNMVVSDNINLSLESLTQGLDMAAVTMANSNNNQDDELVCTPDFPLEPLCEVTEDNTDDDVQCITPGPIMTPKINTPPPLVPRSANTLPELSSDNIVQMTENDVTVNAATGGLKFRVDPQTLSSNKMYRLPDGRIFAINANPNMPGGYSATIVAVTENAVGKSVPKGATYAAKLITVSSPQTPTPPLVKSQRPSNSRAAILKRSTKPTTTVKPSEVAVRHADLTVPIEWYRYNLIDTVDALEYSVSRIQKLKKEATTKYLRSRTIDEMRSLHKSLERILNTSCTRFKEIRENLNKEMRQYLIKKGGVAANVTDDDDDVEILNDMLNDDPIFIDENSEDSNANGNETNCNDNQEVDLTDVTSSEQNESAEKENFESNKDPLADTEASTESFNENCNMSLGEDSNLNEDCKQSENRDKDKVSQSEEQLIENFNNEVNGDVEKTDDKNDDINKKSDIDHDESKQGDDKKSESGHDESKKKDNVKSGSDDDETKKEDNKKTEIGHGESKKEDKAKDDKNEKEKSEKGTEKVDDNDVTDLKQVSEVSMDTIDKIQDIEMVDEKTQDIEMSEEVIESLLKDNGNDNDNSQVTSVDEFQEP